MNDHPVRVMCGHLTPTEDQLHAGDGRLDLMTPAAGYMTGQALRLEGGAAVGQVGQHR
jgi:hypothetical protein